MTIPHCEHNRPDFDQLFIEGKAGEIRAPEALHSGRHHGAACDLICGCHTDNNDGQKNKLNQARNDRRVQEIERSKQSSLSPKDSDDEFPPQIMK